MARADEASYSHEHGAPLIDTERAKERVREAAQSAKSMYQSAKNRAVEFGESFEKGVKERPVQSVLIAAGLGLLVGVLMSRR